MCKIESVSKENFLEVLELLNSLEMKYWIEGGWGVDILLGRQSREHRDIDVDFDHEKKDALLELLKKEGFEITTDWSPARMELYSPKLGYLDIHPLLLNEDGSAKQSDLQGGWYFFEAQWFTCSLFENRRIPCISAEGQKLFHSGYELREVDKRDLECLDKLLSK